MVKHANDNLCSLDHQNYNPWVRTLKLSGYTPRGLFKEDTSFEVVKEMVKICIVSFFRNAVCTEGCNSLSKLDCNILCTANIY